MQISKTGILSNFRCVAGRGQNHEPGFTLIELTVTLLIMSIIFGFALPKIGNVIYSTDLKHSVRRLRATLLVARNQAISERVARRIAVDFEEGVIQIQREVREQGADPLETDEDELAGEEVDYEEENSILVHTYTLPKGVKILDVVTATGDKVTEGVAKQAYLLITPNGMIEGNYIHLEKGERQYTLFINPLTARVTVDEGYVEEFKFEQDAF